MKTVKIYGDEFELQESASTAIYGYFYKGELLDENPGKGKLIGYVQMLDGSTVACYKSFNPLPLVASILLLLLVGGGVTSYFMFFQPKDVNVSPGLKAEDGTPVRVGEDNLLVSYDGFMQASEDGNLTLNFQNGDYPCTIHVSGEGIETQDIQVEPQQFVTSIPVTISTDSGVVTAQISINTATSSTSYDCVVEIPHNNTYNSNTEDNSLVGYWRGEYIIGTQMEDISDNQ